MDTFIFHALSVLYDTIMCLALLLRNDKHGNYLMVCNGTIGFNMKSILGHHMNTVTTCMCTCKTLCILIVLLVERLFFYRNISIFIKICNRSFSSLDLCIVFFFMSFSMLFAIVYS